MNELLFIIWIWNFCCIGIILAVFIWDKMSTWKPEEDRGTGSALYIGNKKILVDEKKSVQVNA